MDNRYLLGIDIGTSGCKTTAFSLTGEVVFHCSESYETSYPADHHVEQNPEDWWRAVCLSIRRMLAESRIRKDEVQAIGVAGQSWAAIPVSKEGQALRNAILWLDRRSTVQCDQLNEQIGEDDIYAISRNPLTPGYTTGKILWIKEHEPEIYKQTYKFLQSNSFIVYKLTGQFTQDVSQGYGIHAFDMARGAWDSAFCNKLGIDPAKLPQIYDCSDVVGGLSALAAAACGLEAGIPVVAGGLDAACGTLGAGVINPGQTQEQGGQAGGMSIVTDKLGECRNLITSYHVVKHRWLLQGGTVGGGSLKWFARELGNCSFEQMSEQAETISVGSDGLIFLPYMAGERSPIWDVHARGVFIGLSYETTKAHMIRAMMEGCAYALQHNILTAEAAGVHVGELHSIGGAANSRVWTQIKADVTGKPIKVLLSDTATTFGAAILAAIGIGLYKDFQCAVENSIDISRVHVPDPSNQEQYKYNVELYLEAYERLKDLFPKLGG